MAEPEVSFQQLVRSDDQRDRWLKQRKSAIRYVEGLNCEDALHQLADQLESHFKKKKRLPSDEDMPDIVASLASLLGLSIDGKDPLSDRPLQVVVVTRVVALFLGRRKPSRRRLAAAAEVEFFLDVRLLAKCIASAPRAKTWLKLLKAAKLEVSTINDDAYVASDETKRWATEAAKPVPTWQVGNFPRMDRSPELLISACLRELDEDAWLSFMDRLPLPMVMESLLWETGVEHDPNRLLDWIRRAPAVFDDQGKRNSSAFAYVLERKALSMLQEFVRWDLRWDASKDDREKLLRRVGPARRELAAALRSRPDGQVLLAELAARLLRMEKFRVDESPNSELLGQFHYYLALDYLDALGSPSEVWKLLRSREDQGNGGWDFWLCAISLAVGGDGVSDAERTESFKECWAWLVALLLARDSSLIEQYRKPAQWTEQLAGLALAACEDPLKALEGLWADLSEQRTMYVESEYEKDPWATSLFLIRAGFYAHHSIQDPQSAEAIWKACMEMAITAWLRRTNLETFDEVVAGLAHLAKHGPAWKAHLTTTLEYFVGLPSEFTRCSSILVHNGLPVEVLDEAAKEAGIDAFAYLSTSRDPRFKDQVEGILARLARSETESSGREMRED